VGGWRTLTVTVTGCEPSERQCKKDKEYVLRALSRNNRNDNQLRGQRGAAFRQAALDTMTLGGLLLAGVTPALPPLDDKPVGVRAPVVEVDEGLE